MDNLPVRLVSAAVAAAIACYAPYRLLPAIAVAGSLGMVAWFWPKGSGLVGVASYSVAAFTVGLRGYLLADFQRVFPMTVVVPAIISLLPALVIYTGLLQPSTGESFFGIVSLVDAGARGLAIAAAVLVAELIGQPVRRRMLRGD